METSKTKWGNRFIVAAIIQGGIMTAIALTTVGVQLVFANKVDIIQFLSLSFEGPAKWFFLGIIFYLIFIVAIAVTSVFYIHLENNLKKRFSGLANLLAWIHLLGMNVGGPGATILMIFAGLSGSGVLSIFNEGKIGLQNVAVMDAFIPPIAGFIAVLSFGVISGGIGYVLAYRRTNQ
jgi:hypothetical protein